MPGFLNLGYAHDKVEFVLSEQFFDEWAAQRLDFFLIHDDPPVQRWISKER